MDHNARYSIGDISQLCNISKKALRYYDKIGLLSTTRHNSNNYRYYTVESILNVLVLKYYKLMGFRLEEMKPLIEGHSPDVFKSLQKAFIFKLHELDLEREAINRKYLYIKDWHDLILEAEEVIENNIVDVSIKHVKPVDLLFQEHFFDENYNLDLSNITFIKYVEQLNNEITGPVFINYSSIKNRISKKAQKIKIMYKALLPCPEEIMFRFGGGFMASCYHIGKLDTLCDTYTKICRWALEHEYILADDSCERYVIDCWTTKDEALCVTEVLIRVSRPSPNQVNSPSQQC